MADGGGTWWRHQWLSSGLLSLAVHVVLIAAATFTLGSTERTAGEGDDLVFIEGIPVTLVESIPSLPSLASDGEADAEEPADEPIPPEDPPEPPTEPEPEPTEPIDPPPDEAEPPPPEPVESEPPNPEESVASPEPAIEPHVDPTVMPAPPQPRARPRRPEPVETAARTVERPPETPKQKKPPPPKRASAPSDAGAASSGAGGGGQGLGQGDPQASRYRSQVAAKLMANRFYPNGARRHRLEGTATVAFMIDRRGRAGDIAVVGSSGSAILDEAARSMVRRAEPFPPPPASLGGSVAIRAPLRFEMPR